MQKLLTVRSRPFVAALLCVVTLGFLPEAASAHAVVTENSLKHHPIEIDHPTQVTLHFNSGVELALSRVYLVSKGDVFQPVEFSNGTKPGEMLINIPPLQEGDYAIKYKVFAADGHLTEDVLRFRVAAKR